MTRVTAFSLSFFTIILLLVGPSLQQQPDVIRLGAIYDLTSVTLETNASHPVSDNVISMASALRLGIEDVNQRGAILPQTTLELEIFDSQSTILGAISALLEASQRNISLIAGPNSFEQCDIIAVASKSYEVLLLSAAASATTLSSRQLFPLFSRTTPSEGFQTSAMVELINYYYEETGEPKWLDVAIICTANDYGVGGSREFIARAPSRNITVKTFQQFLVGEEDLHVEIEQLAGTEARVFISFMHAKDFQSTVKEAEKQGLIGNEYIWICSDGCATSEIFEDLDDNDELHMRRITRGIFGTVTQGGYGPVYEDFRSRWRSLDTDEYPGAGSSPSLFTQFAYDSAETMARLYKIQFDQGNFYPNGSTLLQGVSLIDFEGVSGRVQMFGNGDRIANYDIVNLYKNEFRTVFTWTNLTGIQPVPDVKAHFYDGTTNIPDLGILSPFDYWSCHDKESYTDRTGKRIIRETPDGSDPNNIDISYECDQYIDCDNLSDESPHCVPSLVVAFIVLGIITGLLVLFNILFIPISILFGWIVVRARFTLAGRLFLLFLSLGTFFGLVSTFAWYGKPHTVACNFQLWLFGLAVTLVVNAIFSKNLMKFRTQGIPINRVRKINIYPDLEFLIYFLLTSIVPLIIIIIWGAFATPVAKVDEYNDRDHFMCTTGGLIGEPAGVVFFFVLVGYFGFLLLISFCLLFLNRKAPNFFMESRLMFISIFNLGFLSAVIIPIIFVLHSISPFGEFMVRTLGIIYGFTSTLWLHMIPKLVGLALRDKFKDNGGVQKGGTQARTNISHDDTSQSMSSYSGTVG